MLGLNPKSQILNPFVEVMKRLLTLSLFAAVLFAEDKVDLAVVQRIKMEAFQNSKVMDHLFWLTDVYGPRLTGSPGFTAAANWTVKQLKQYGIEDAATQPWGKFGRSWRLTKFSVSIQEPEYAPLIGFPLAWSADTKGPIVAEPVLAPLKLTDRFGRQENGTRSSKSIFASIRASCAARSCCWKSRRDVTPVTTASRLALFRRRPGEGGGCAHAVRAAAVRYREDGAAGKARGAPRLVRSPPARCRGQDLGV